MTKLFIFNHTADEWIHPWNQLQIDYFTKAGYEVVEKRVNAVGGNDKELAKELEGHYALQPRVLGLVHNAHSAFAELFQYSISR